MALYIFDSRIAFGFFLHVDFQFRIKIVIPSQWCLQYTFLEIRFNSLKLGCDNLNRGLAGRNSKMVDI